jgi:hypothetical protein
MNATRSLERLPRIALITCLLSVAPLHADVDLSHLSDKWVRQETPEAFATQMKAGGTECHGYFTTADATAILIHNSKPFTGPVNPSQYDLGLESVKSGFEKAAARAGMSLAQNEIVEKGGVRLLHQEYVQDGSIQLVLNQMTPTRIEQIMLIVPAADRDPMVKEAYALFRPLASPAVLATGPDSPAEGSDAYKFGYVVGTISVAVILIALVLTACGVMKFSRKGSP